MLHRSALFLALLASLLPGCAGDESGVHGTSACVHMIQGSCHATFRSLAQDPAAFDGREITIEGYLGVTRGMFVLSSSKELFDAGVRDESLLLVRGPVAMQEMIFNEHAYTWVSMTATFRVRKADRTIFDMVIGELHAPLDARSLRLPGPERREEFGDVILYLEDLK